MKKRIEDLNEFLTALDNGMKVSDEDENCRDLDRENSIKHIEKAIAGGLFIEIPDPEPPRYVYLKLNWEEPMPQVDIKNRNGIQLTYLPFVGLRHWENGREYRLKGFTVEKPDDLVSLTTYTDEIMEYAKFELQMEIRGNKNGSHF